jgi:hypothetical protein
MKKILFTAIALSALLLSGECSAKGKGTIPLTDKCEETCNQQGKRVDFQYTEETGECKCSTGGRN